MKNYYPLSSFKVSRILGSLILLLTLFSCHKKLMMEKIATPHIAFGSGGGFTGMVKQYHLLEDGQIVEEVKMNDSIHYNVVAEIGKSKAKEYFSTMKKMQLDSLHFNEPSNRYSFLSVPTKDSLVRNRIVWGHKDNGIPSEVQNFYQTLSGYVRKDEDKDKHEDKDRDKHKNKEKVKEKDE
jgi:hypothetical protein